MELKQNQIVQARVVKLKRFGVFLEILGHTDELGFHETGLLHISEISNKLVRNTKLEKGEYFQIGDILNVRIRSLEKKGQRRISLSLKDHERKDQYNEPLIIKQDLDNARTIDTNTNS